MFFSLSFQDPTRKRVHENSSTKMLYSCCQLHRGTLQSASSVSGCGLDLFIGAGWAAHRFHAKLPERISMYS